MSAIAGVVHVDGRLADPALLARMAQALAHRGPGDGQWVSGAVGLASRTGSLADKQPVSDALAERALIFDGRLDERVALCTSLRVRPGVSDAELALAAVAAWGADGGARLLGDFALAAWDARSRTLSCARDAFGARPLYYHWDGRRLLFASEVGALFADPSIARSPDPSTIADFLLMDFRDPGATFFAGIRRVPPAHVLTVGAHGLTLRRSWLPDVARPPSSEPEHSAELAARFRRAVEDRLRDAPVAGVLLSGGIDSTLVAAAAARARRERPPGDWLASLTFLHDGFLAEDWEAIRDVTACGGIHAPRTIRGMALLDMALASTEPPDYRGHPVLGAMLDAPSAAEYRVLLTGIGGDELSGAAERGALGDRLRALRARAAWRGATAMARAYGGDGGWRATAETLWPVLPTGARRAIKVLARRHAPSWLAPRLARARRERLAPSPRPELPTQAAVAVWNAVTAPALSLALEKMDAEAARLGIEARHPYLDRRVVECMLATPPDTLLRHGFRKQCLQRALAGLLPGPPRGDERAAEHVPATDPTVAQQHEADRLQRGLFTPLARVFEYVDRAQVERMRDAHLAGDSRHRVRLWHFLLLETWLQRTFA
ncbi:MAG TPA: asparagine synthase-related protein [Methylomirabilota bacterium]|nr:asparagine synthase-related protein [Methylomirabilota bacterium]